MGDQKITFSEFGFFPHVRMSTNFTHHHGVGAIASCKMRFLHPSQLVREYYVNANRDLEITELLEVRRETKTINRRQQLCIVMRHDDFPNQLLHAVQRWVKVTREAPSRFDTADEDMVEAAAAATAPIREQNNNEDALISVSHADDVARYQNEGFLVDDDNDPAPENIAVECNDPTITYDKWGWNGIDYHLQSGNTKSEPNIIDDDH